jgi:predicted enzyme related to lactoylglutathione lyase
MTTALKTKKAPAAKKTPAIKKSALPSKIGYFIHYVPDMTKAIEFFKSIGLKATFESPEWTEFDAGIKFALHGMDCSSSKPAHSHAGINTNLTFSVKNVDDTLAAFKTLGVKISSEPRQVCESGRSFSFQDPFGNTFSIYGK